MLPHEKFYGTPSFGSQRAIADPTAAEAVAGDE
jgi:hypothetical protein